MRVHHEILAKQKLPPKLVTKRIWEERYQDIAAHERYLARNGVLILKFFLHVSKAEQKKRFLERTDEPEKNWKFSSADVEERTHWKKYMAAYEDMIRATAAPHAPWFVVPADKKWFTRLVVAGAVADAMEKLGLAFPVLDAAQKADLAAARRELAREGKKRVPPARRARGTSRTTSAEAEPAPTPGTGSEPIAPEGGPPYAS